MNCSRQLTNTGRFDYNLSVPNRKGVYIGQRFGTAMRVGNVAKALTGSFGLLWRIVGYAVILAVPKDTRTIRVIPRSLIENTRRQSNSRRSALRHQEQRKAREVAVVGRRDDEQTSSYSAGYESPQRKLRTLTCCRRVLPPDVCRLRSRKH